MQNIVLINNSRIAWPTRILMSVLSFSDNMLQDDYISLQKSVRNFEIAHKRYSIYVKSALTP